MSSEPSTAAPNRLRLAAWALALLLLAGTLAACGNKKPPTPPASKVPAPPRDLTIQQRGNEFILRLSYPTMTMGGALLEEIEAIEVWELVRIVPLLTGTVEEIAEDIAATEGLEQGPVELPDEEPMGLLFQVPTEVLAEEGLEETALESLIFVDPREYPKLATLRTTVSAEDLDDMSAGDQVTVHIPIATAVLEEAEREAEAEGEEGAEGAPEQQGSVLAARVKAPGRRPGPFSNLVTLVPREAPPAPDAVEVTPSDLGVMLTWAGGDPDLEGYRVYRRSPKSKEYGDPLASLPATATTYTDTTAALGTRYVYTVTAVSSNRPLVESAITSERQVNYRDRFAPLAPRNLVAFPEPGRVRLLWDPPTAEDVEGYLIYRSDQGGEFRLLDTELVVKAEFLDTGVASGGAYRYMVRAVDRAGNESETSEEIEVRVP